MTKLYEITSAMRALMDTLSDAPMNGDTDEAKAEHKLALAAFESTTDDLRQKLRAYTAYALELRVEREAREAHIAAIIANVIDKMHKANERDQKKENWLLEQVRTVSLATGMLTPMKFPEFTIALQKLPGSCVIKDEAALPTEYLRTVPAVAESRVPDKKKLLADLRDGLVIPGAALSEAQYALKVK
jgi:hypothetical protein